MRDRLNFFEPWESLPANHENQLTRALLIVLRYCPIAQQAWLSLVDHNLPLHSLPRPTFDTQRGKILRSEDQSPTTDELIKGISVLCAAEAPSEAPDVILESDRGQVLDGIIRYGDEMVVVLESKLDGPADDRQARNINLHNQPILFDGHVRRISWRDVLATFTDLALEKRGLVSGAERMILADFLDFVGRNFPQLGPFKTLARCEAEPSRVARRLQTILSEVLGSDDATLPGTHTSVTTAYLVYESRQVKLDMYPADTLQQARACYDRPNVVERILMLEREGWRVRPNFHFGFMAKGFCWTKTTLPLAEYLYHWQQNIRNTAQIERRHWDDYWDKLLKAKIAEASDREDFNRNYTNTNRPSATPRPGIACTFLWNLDEAERLDARGLLTKAVKERVNQLLDVLGEDKIDAEQTHVYAKPNYGVATHGPAQAGAAKPVN